ncbi:MAG: DUF1624 domain-containing protein [Chlorobi bacterium]|nr:DUF1624 domain-containing protein [Chlorobiota bacterium]
MIKTQRLVALDVYRGLTIILMIIVNTPGTWAHVWPPLDHSPWNGCTPTDLVFPSFLFIVGVAMWFSFRKFDHKLNRPALMKILRRTLLIFLIGLLINFLFVLNLKNLRIPGVLQRIALAYGMAAILVTLLDRKWRWITAAFILLAYWGILMLFGGEHPLELLTNVVRRIDLSLLGPNHVWHGFPLDSPNKIPFDPEGILSTFPAIVNVILGYQVGELIGTSSNHAQVSRRLLIFGVAGVILGLIWNMVLPINKPIWTSSYVVYTTGIGTLILALFLWVIDVKGWQKWTNPFRVYGMNPLFVYVLADLWVILLFAVRLPLHGEKLDGYAWLYNAVFVPLSGNNAFSSFLFGLAHVCLFWIVAEILYRKRIFIKI